MLGTSGYVWLPVEIDKDGKMSISSASNWTLEDLKASAKLSFAALDAQIEIANTKAKADYTPASWTAFKTVLDEVVAGRDALAAQTDINAAKDRLMQAMNDLVAKSSLNVDALNAAITAADGLTRSDYVGTTDWNAFDAVLASAKTALENKNSQKDIDDAAKALTDALNGLEKKAVLDYTLIDQIIAKANSLSAADYLEAAQTAIANLKARALEVKDAADDQDELNASCLTLNRDLLALRKTPASDKLPE